MPNSGPIGVKEGSWWERRRKQTLDKYKSVSRIKRSESIVVVSDSCPDNTRFHKNTLRDAGADDSRARLGTSEASCRLSPSQVAGQPLSDGGRHGRSDNLGYQCIMRHCTKGSRQVYGHTHCTVRWFPLIEACLDVRCKLEEGRCSLYEVPCDESLPGLGIGMTNEAFQIDGRRQDLRPDTGLKNWCFW